MSKDEFYQAIMQSAVDPIIVIDATGIIVDCNDATADTFKFSKQELITQNVKLLMPEHEAQHHDGFIRNFLQTDQPKVIGTGREVLAQKKDGTLFHCYLAVNNIQVNNTTYFTGILRNIQETKQAQQQLELNFQTLSLLNDWVISGESAIPDKNAAFVRLMSDVTHADYAFFVPTTSYFELSASAYPFDMPMAMKDWFNRHLNILDRVHQDLDLTSREHIHSMLPNPPSSLSRLLHIPIYSAENRLGSITLLWQQRNSNHALGITHDLIHTCINSFAKFLDLECTNHQLKIANDRFYRSQTAADIGTWDWDISTGALFWSERIAPLFGYPEGELETSYENFLASVHPDDRERVQNAVDACINDGAHYDIDHRIVWPNGEVRWVNEKGDVSRDSQGNVIKMLGVVQDISRAKHAEENLLKARVRAEKASRAKSEFLSLMSHELRTPLNTVLGFTQLLRQEELSDNQSLYTEQIHDGSQMLLKLVNNVLDLSRIEADPEQAKLEAVDLHHLTQSCLSQMKAQAQKAGITLEHQCDGNHPFVKADFLRLKQGVLNLISNAIKYNRPEGIVSVNCETINGDFLRLTVKDTGKGIPAERQAELFQPFSRLDFKNSSIEGAGIGLLITKKLIESMHGEVGVESTPGEGSVFWIDLPTVRGNNLAYSPPIDVSCSPPQNLKLLYIEDNDSNLRLMKSLLTQQSSHVFLQARTAREGIATAKQERPSVIIMDINLPDISGIEACSRLKAHKETAHIPIIALTADMVRQSDKLIESGDFFQIITKPFNLQELLAAISNACDTEGTIH